MTKVTLWTKQERGRHLTDRTAWPYPGAISWLGDYAPGAKIVSAKRHPNTKAGLVVGTEMVVSIGRWTGRRTAISSAHGLARLALLNLIRKRLAAWKRRRARTVVGVLSALSELGGEESEQTDGTLFNIMMNEARAWRKACCQGYQRTQRAKQKYLESKHIAGRTLWDWALELRMVTE